MKQRMSKKINKFLNLDLDLLKNQSPKHFNKINDDEIIVNEKMKNFFTIDIMILNIFLVILK